MGEFFVTTSWDDGAKEDLKLADLLLKYDVPATFYLPLRNPERKVMNTREIKEIGERFEIGGHTANHKILTFASAHDTDITKFFQIYSVGGLIFPEVR